ncbi:coiled-coil domain-containing protein 174-like [Centruroides sculpturatus]|uniref:coiled-coil domain-containing protein 174-like n=1 Tax=Centruroides sculpturatus TaxID=218467 RepID=UPI000C6CED54|nr:coiled-coil domain-containing protein 174-like [Centruroides sculpturatus]
MSVLTVLEKKAKIYESLTDGNVPNDEVKELYLVDFQRKVLDQKKLGKPKEVEKKSISSPKPNTNVNEEKKEDIDFDDTSSHSLDKDDSEAPNPDEEWVDYTDSLGRSRRCLRKDLPDLLEMDKQLKKTNKILGVLTLKEINKFNLIFKNNILAYFSYYLFLFFYRTVLEKKAKIYESLTDGNVPNDEVKELYLVDFQRKVLDQKKLGKPKEVEKKSISSPKPNTNVNEEKKEDIDFDDTSSHSLDKDDSEAPNPDEEWVDYTDSLGRSRRCLRKDLPDLLEMDKQLKKTNKIVPEEDQSVVNQESSENISSDLPEVETPAEPVHYQTVQNNEIRSHGVGYYSFSTEEEERKAQLENLNQLREQTVKQRSARERLKEKRKAILKARLDKVKKRKNIEVEESNESMSDEEFDPLKPPVQEEVKEEKPETSPKVRPWDVGKVFNTQKQKYKYTQESWIEERRTDRIKEFAPPTSYHKNTDNDEKSDQEKSDSPEFTEEVKEDAEEIEEDNKVNENDSIPLSQATSDSEIERMIAETVTYYRKQTE